ncbi:hypothetical protein MBLNU230_g7549t1 [Neophaeotheca triangularis]
MSAFTEANRKAFNDLSAEYNSKPWQHKLSQQISDALKERKTWLGAQWTNVAPQGTDVRLLDYACGTGAITQALGPYVSTIRGIDVSENMVENYNSTARTSGLSEEQAHAVVGDLLGEEVPEPLSGPEWTGFDVAVIGLGFHHFEDPVRATKRLAERLKPGKGVLVIVDFLPFDHDGQKHGDMGAMQHTIKHNGFNSEQMREMFEQSGLEDFGFDVLDEPAVMWIKDEERRRKVFVAKGRRSGSAWSKITTWFSGVQDGIGEQLKV